MAVGIVVPLASFMTDGMLLRGLFPGVAVFFVAGMLDDRFNLDYRIKFAAQVAAVLTTLVLSDLNLRNLGEVIPGCRLSCGIVEIPLTAFFLLAVINSINLADGLDGLAAGICLLVLAAVVVLGLAEGNRTAIGLAVCTAGALVGFLRYNTHPAVVFMGDTGSQILGFIVGCTLLAHHRGLPSPNPGFMLFLLGVPILDTLSVMTQRILEGRSPFRADRNHLHHILLQKGLQHHHGKRLANYRERSASANCSGASLCGSSAA